MDKISQMLKQNKPDITDSSIRAYTANLSKLHSRLHGSRDFTDVKWLNDTAAVLTSLDSTCGSYLTCRNYLNAIVVVLLNRPEYEPALRKYQERRDELNQKYTDQQQTKQPSEKQSKNWVSVAEINQLIDELTLETKQYKGYTKLSPKELSVFQDRFMLIFWLSYPVRNDLHTTRVITRRAFNALPREQKETQNFIIGGKPAIEFSIGNYKTRKKYGVKKIRVDDKVVLAAMRQWLSVSPNPDYILVNVKNGEPMSSLNITQALTRIFKTHFNKNVSTTLLRHIVLTEKFGKQLQEMEQMADVMGHNISTAQSVYIKNVDADA